MSNVHSADPTISLWYVLISIEFNFTSSKLTFFLKKTFQGKPDSFRKVAQRLDVPVLGELPLVQGVSTSADEGWPFVLSSSKTVQETDGLGEVAWKESMMRIASSVVSALNLPLHKP